MTGRAGVTGADGRPATVDVAAVDDHPVILDGMASWISVRLGQTGHGAGGDACWCARLRAQERGDRAGPGGH